MNPIINAIDMMGLDHDKDKPVLMTWALEAEKQIGSRFQYERKRAVLTISGCAACLPDDAACLERALMGDHGCDCESLFNSCFGSGNVFVNQANGDLSGFLIVDISAGTEGEQVPYGLVAYEIQDNKILFNSNYDGQSVTIQYLGVKSDCDGFPMISENHVRAITLYLQYKQSCRKKRKTGAEFNEMQFYLNEWQRAAANAVADDNILTESDRIIISNVINDPYAGKGLWRGMRTTLDYGANLF